MITTFPAEIRTMIWTLSFEDAHILELAELGDMLAVRWTAWLSAWKKQDGLALIDRRLSSPPLQILRQHPLCHTCAESRGIALALLEREQGPLQQILWITYSASLRLQYEDLKPVDPFALTHITTLMVEHATWEENEEWECLALFPYLEEVHIFLQEDDLYFDDSTKKRIADHTLTEKELLNSAHEAKANDIERFGDLKCVLVYQTRKKVYLRCQLDGEPGTSPDDQLKP